MAVIVQHAGHRPYPPAPPGFPSIAFCHQVSLRFESLRLIGDGRLPGGAEGADPPQQDRPGRAGAEVAILRGCRLRPVEAVQSWLAAAEITDGPVFRAGEKGGRVQAAPLTPHSAAQIVKAYAKRAGLDAQGFAGHSLRSGFLTSAAESGASVFKMMEVSGTSRWICYAAM